MRVDSKYVKKVMKELDIPIPNHIIKINKEIHDDIFHSLCESLVAKYIDKKEFIKRIKSKCLKYNNKNW